MADGGAYLKTGGKFGDYDVLRLLGRGNMGEVYLIRSPEDGEFYAVKVMAHPTGADAHEWRRRFANEASFAMKVEHENLIRVYDVGQDPDTGLCYIIMDYLGGGSLSERIKKQGRLPVEEAVGIAAQIADALEVAHAAGIVHRDIKPDNILFDSAGVPHLADLGIAKFSGDGTEATLTMANSVFGTPAYMSPEQMIDAHRADARSDIYSLGIVLYEMLAGKRPNAGATIMELMAKAVKKEKLPDVRTVRPETPATVAAVLAAMTAADVEYRPRNAISAAKLLRAAAAGKLRLPNENDGQSAASGTEAKKRKAKAAAAVAGLAFAALFAVAFVFRNGQAPQPPNPAPAQPPAKPSALQTAQPPNRKARYVAIDISGGRDAAHWPVQTMDDPPPGGWSDEYKTVKLVLRRIEPGTFFMGTSGSGPRERRHKVELTKPYCIGVFEVTQKQFELVTGSNPALIKGDTLPVTQAGFKAIRGAGSPGFDWPRSKRVSADSFAGTLREKTGIETFDLPTEAQWEYACRGGKDASPSVPPLAETAVFRYSPAVRGGAAAPRPAGSLKPNGLGLYDMLGNVWEQCLDWAGPFSGEDAVDPEGPEKSLKGNVRVKRGGSFLSDAGECRSAAREAIEPDRAGRETGFRIACGEVAAPAAPHPAKAAAPAAPRHIDGSSGLYLAIDVSGGPDAERWPVSYSDRVPDGGWTGRYTTDKIVLRRIEPGSFFMGSPEDEPGRGVDETRRRVSLGNAYYIGVYEITQRQFELVFGANPSKGVKEPSNPVDSVDFEMACGGEKSFVARLRAKTGLKISLPTEVQWEYACRAQTQGAFNTGGQEASLDEQAREAARCRLNSLSSMLDNDGGKKFARTATTVGRYKPNAWGLYDMHGNVAEWCRDTVVNPHGAAKQAVRGGCYEDEAEKCRSASRAFVPQDAASPKIGLRIVCPPPANHPTAKPHNHPTT